MKLLNLFYLSIYLSVLVSHASAEESRSEELTDATADVTFAEKTAEEETNSEEIIVPEDINEVEAETVQPLEKVDETEVAETDEVLEINDSSENSPAYQEGVTTASVDTILGTITGTKQKTDDGHTLYAFLGIPFAQPPTGSRRFKPPIPVTAFENYDATYFRSECLQIPFYGPKRGSVAGNEDCLYLNIFTSSLTTTKEALKPVMVWIHGGGFQSGSAIEYVPVPLTNKDVLVVTINYRMSGFGFLTFGNEIVSGNMGLRDQIEALKWVKRFINSFGGDPNKITIFGHSSGANSVSALQLSPQATGLFSAAITQSGNMLQRHIKPESAKEERNAKQLAEKFNCKSINYDEEMLECLQSIDATEFLVNSQYVGPVSASSLEDRERSMWAPVVDAYSPDPILPLDPLHALKVGAYNKVPMISGTVLNEGGVPVMALLGPIPDKEQTWSDIGAQQMQITASGNMTETSENEIFLKNMATKYYTGEIFDLRISGEGWMNLFTDIMFLSPDQKMMEILSEAKVPVYNYLFSFVGENTVAEWYGAPDNSLSPVHGDDTLHFFQSIGGVKIQTEEEKRLSEKMTSYWTNFAKYGNPSPFMYDDLPQWKPYSDKKRYLELNTKPEMKSRVAPERMLFWQRLLWDQKENEIEKWGLYQHFSNLLIIGSRPKY